MRTSAALRSFRGGQGRGDDAATEPRRRLAAIAARFGLRGWRRGVALVASGLGAVLIALGALGAQGAQGGTGSARLMPGTPMPEIIGFYQNGWSQIFRSSFASVRNHYRYINTVLAFWYSVDGNGVLHANQPNASVTAWIKRHHMRMGVLINNIAGTSGDNAGMLRTSAMRRKATAAIAQMVAKSHYQEVNIDFELLPTSVRNDLTLFMRDLRAALPKSVTLSESVFPKVGVTSDVNGAYNYLALSRVVNYLVIMLYDKHSSGGPAGPISPYPWVVANMNWFLHTDKIPASKLVLAAGVYGYDWPKGSNHANELPLNAVDALRKKQHATVQTDRASGDPFFRYTDSSGTPHIVWFQNRQTVRQRLVLAKRLGIRGVAIWALGQETPAVWSVIEQTTGPARRS